MNYERKYHSRLVIWGIALVSLLAPLFYKSGFVSYAGFPKLALLHISVIISATVLSVQSFRKGSLEWVSSPLYLPLGFFLLLISVSMLYAQNFQEAWPVWLQWSACILAYFVMVSSIRSENDSDVLTGAIFLSALLVSLLGLYQFFFDFHGIPQTVAPAATFGNKNVAAHYVVLCLPAGLYFWLRARHAGWCWLVSLAVTTMALFLFYSATKGAWLACAVESICVLVVLLYWSIFRGDSSWLNRQKLFAAVVCIILLGVVVGFFGRQNPLSALKESVVSAVQPVAGVQQKMYSSGQVRLAIWRNSIEMIKDNPLLGVGLGNHKVSYPLYHQRVVVDKQFGHRAQLENIHNDYLQFIAETGLGGGILLIWLTGAIAWLLRGVFITIPAQSVVDRYRQTAVGVALAGLAVSSFFSFPMQLPLPPFVLMVFLALLTVCDSKKRKSYSGTVFLSAGVLIGLILLSCVILYYAHEFKERRYYFNVVVAESRKDWKGMLERMPPDEHRYINRTKFQYYTAEAYMKLKQYGKAVESLEEYLLEYPYNINALRNLSVLYSRLGEPGKAGEYMKRYFDIMPDDPAARILQGKGR